MFWYGYKSGLWPVDPDPTISVLFAMFVMAGLLDEIYSWHMLGFFHPKKSVNSAVLLPPSAALLVAEVLLKLWNVYRKRVRQAEQGSNVVGQLCKCVSPHWLVFQHVRLWASKPHSSLVLLQLTVHFEEVESELSCIAACLRHDEPALKLVTPGQLGPSLPLWIFSSIRSMHSCRHRSPKKATSPDAQASTHCPPTWQPWTPLTERH